MTARIAYDGATTLVLEERPPLNPDVERYVGTLWQAECAKRPGLFDGPLLSANALSGATLSCCTVSYRHFVAQRADADLYAKLQVAPVGVSGLVLTRDGSILVGRRSANVTQYPGWLEAVPSGSIDAKAIEHGQIDASRTLLIELEEEARIDTASILSVRARALVYDEEEKTYDVVYVIALKHTSAELAAHIATLPKGEYESLQILIPGTSLNAGPNVVPTTELLLRLRL